jgi:site-specific recombinase XerD
MTPESVKTTELAEAPPTVPSVAVQEAAADAEVFATASRASSTWRAYESDWRIFTHWCQAMDLSALPAAPATVAMFLAAEAKKGTAPSTLNRRLSAIRLMHLGAAGLAARRRRNPGGHARHPAALDARRRQKRSRGR